MPFTHCLGLLLTSCCHVCYLSSMLSSAGVTSGIVVCCGHCQLAPLLFIVVVLGCSSCWDKQEPKIEQQLNKQRLNMYKYILWHCAHRPLMYSHTQLSQHGSRRQVSHATPVPSWTKSSCWRFGICTHVTAAIHLSRTGQGGSPRGYRAQTICCACRLGHRYVFFYMFLYTFN